MRWLLAFVPVAALLTITPGAATAMVVRSAVRGGRRRALLTTIGNSIGVLAWACFPKLAVFFAALFPQFVPDGASVLVCALLMAALVVVFDLVWNSTLAYLVARARRAFVEGPWLARAERFTGAVLVGLGVRLALERR